MLGCAVGTGRTVGVGSAARINQSVDSTTTPSVDHLSALLSDSSLRSKQTGGSRMLSEKSLLMSEKVLFMVAGPMALLGTIAALIG
jgi:hypothetical protein